MDIIRVQVPCCSKSVDRPCVKALRKVLGGRVQVVEHVVALSPAYQADGVVIDPFQ